MVAVLTVKTSLSIAGVFELETGNTSYSWQARQHFGEIEKSQQFAPRERNDN
jgi:hypothetical protein